MALSEEKKKKIEAEEKYRAQMISKYSRTIEKHGGKNKIVAGVLAILLGGLGIHKFYLGKIGWGIIYLLFCWILIPSILGVIEGIIYLTMSDEAFEAKYS